MGQVHDFRDDGQSGFFVWPSQQQLGCPLRPQALEGVGGSTGLEMRRRGARSHRPP